MNIHTHGWWICPFIHSSLFLTHSLHLRNLHPHLCISSRWSKQVNKKWDLCPCPLSSIRQSHRQKQTHTHTYTEDPTLTCSHILVLIKAGKRDVGSADVPHIDIVVQQQGAAGDVEATIGAPLDAPHRGDGLHGVQQLRRLPADVPHLHGAHIGLTEASHADESLSPVTIQLTHWGTCLS